MVAALVTEGAVGAVVSMVISNSLEALLSDPDADDFAVSVHTPSVSEVLGVTDHRPSPSAVPVPRSVPLPYRLTTVPAATVPVSVGVALFVT